jgi:hypothetical protein
MNYIVHWTDIALDELAAVWTAAADRNAVTTASHQLEQDLAADPRGRGLFRASSANYTAVDLPLGIEYDIIEDDKTVRILRVWSLI